MQPSEPEHHLDGLGPISYAELHELAASILRRRHIGGPQTTSLLHEAYLRIADRLRREHPSREHVLALAARAMRCVLIDHARRARSVKRGRNWQRVSLARGVAVELQSETDLLAIDEALRKLAELDPDKARLVELRFFGGLSIEEAAEVLGVSPATLKRQWALARAWLKRELDDDGRSRQETRP